MHDLYVFWQKGWGFDALYDIIFVRPFVWIAQLNKNDVVDKFYTGLVEFAGVFHRIFAWTQSGILRWYMIGIVIGTLLVVTIGMLIN
jgi:NADH-quinone oxidoreductase subunit L